MNGPAEPTRLPGLHSPDPQALDPHTGALDQHALDSLENQSTFPAAAVSRWRSLLSPRFLYALLDQGIVSFGNMVVAASISRHSPTAAFGLFILALRSLDVLNQIAGVLIWGPYIFNLPSMSGLRKRRYLGSVLFHQGVANALGMGAFLLFALFTLRRESTYTALFFALILPSIAIVFREFVRRVYFAHLRFRDAFLTDAVTVALQVAAILLVIHRHTLTLSSALWALSIPCILGSLYWIVTERHTLSLHLPDVIADFRLNMELGRWFFGSNMVIVGSNQVSPWVLSATLGPSAVAAYAVCEAVVNIPRVALTSMQNAMGPTMARSFASGGKPALRRVVRRMELIILGGSTLFALLIISAGPWIAHAIFHTSPANSRIILILLALNLVAYAASLAQSYGLSSMNLAKLNFHPQLAGLAVQLIVVALCVHSLGIPGVALALLLSSVVVFLLRSSFYAREIRRP